MYGKYRRYPPAYLTNLFDISVPLEGAPSYTSFSEVSPSVLGH